MNHASRIMPVLAFLNIVPTLAACSVEKTPSAASPARCDAAAARTLVGKLKPTEEEAKRLTGATTVRQIAPGQPVTHDYREARITVETDPSSGRVVGVTCG
ncbi:I78 family peptidase inhibitor [Neorhizobium sp. DT-125]|uniref:I78 family peptidase inhibitor n=1 Tax=Neorhizobium sp. DT-125 TaxID=3396163 RepID=UPI003F1BC61C